MKMTKFARPTPTEIRDVLAKRCALIVHFSGTPKGGGSNFELPFPQDLEEVIGGRSHTGLSCSTVMPGDNIGSLPSANSTGCIGVILGMQTPHSLLDALPRDCGSYIVDGVRLVPHARDMTAADLAATIDARARDDYNEWVLGNYDVIGLFAAEPYRVSTQVKVDYPEDMPDYLRESATAPGFAYKSPDDLALLFPDMAIYSFRNSEIVQRASDQWVPVAHEALYP